MPLLLPESDFRNPTRAREELLHLSGLPELSLQRLAVLIESSPDPDQAVHYLNRFHAESPEGFDHVMAAPGGLRFALTVFGYSSFLSEAVIRNPEWLVQTAQSRDLHRVLRRDEYEERLGRYLGASRTAIPSAYVLACFRRREILRILLRDVLRLGSLSDVTEEISNLADAILDVSLAAIRREFSAQFPDAAPNGRFSVIALGKLGGQELNYSSDIDLMFVYSGDEPAVAQTLTPKEFFKKVANHLTQLLSTYTAAGLCYRIDLRLRPDGRYGEVCHSVEGARRYYGVRARDWELQMLIKARVAAGDPEPGRELLEFVEPLIYSTTLDFKAVESVSEARQRIHEKLKRSRQAGLDIKLASGGIRDIEFLVQCLQRLHGGREPWVRHGGTMFALFRLRDKDFLSDREYSRLVSAYQFLRQLEHRLQFLEDRQTHSLPTDPELLRTLARRMPESSFHEATAGSLERELDGHLGAVRELYERVIHSQRAEYFIAADLTPAVPPAPGASAGAIQVDFPSGNLARFLEQRTPQFMARLREARLSRGQERFEHFLEKIANEPGQLDLLELNPELTRATIDFFEHSPYFGDQLIRHPGLLLEVAEACGEHQGRVGFHAPGDLAGLRRFYREQMTRIQSDSVYHGVNVFKTLKRTSDLADAVISAAYGIALAEALASSPPRNPNYRPGKKMMIIALGRLGMREFDLASDADLVFAIPDEEASEMVFWTAVAERVIHVISAYTGDGVIFTVDTRLRPNGREGDLVQTETFYKDYFAHHAEAWEGIAYMKSRVVAGDMEGATRFLNELQEVDWRRYGQSGRSRRQLAEMRAKIEKEQGARNLLKAGPGGYYDLDFTLLYLRLKGAGIFFKVLNTPERIDIVEKMGHLDREDAEFMREAATFYRAVDHGMRVSTGHAEGSLPTSPNQREMLCELVRRWAPERLVQVAGENLLQGTLNQMRTRTRALFDRVFS